MAPGGLPMAALSLYILTFNCGLQQIETNAVASQLFNGLATPQLPDLLVLSLQEIAPLPKALIGGSFLVPQFTKFHDAVEQAAKKLGNGTGQDPVYTAVSARNLGMTAIMVFAKNPAAIQNMETGGVGLGLWETGNKGAVGVRFLYNDVNGGGETELTFVAAHLAAMEDEVERRNQDWKDIVRGLVFSSTSQDLKNARSLSSEDLPLLSISPRDASIFKPTSHLFIAGDLNYRTSSIKPSLTDYHDTFPQPHHGNDHSNHWTKLFEHDQLNHERAAGRTMHGLLEPEITFPPTYKYESIEPFLTPDEDLSRWPWARHRWPSWCDRILYLDVPPWLTRSHPAKITTHKYTSLPLFPTSDHRAVALSVSVPLIPIPSPSEEDEESEDPRIKPPFDVNPDWKSARERARMLEVVLGFGLYFITTLEGALVMGATVLGVVGGYYVLKALISF